MLNSNQTTDTKEAILTAAKRGAYRQQAAERAKIDTGYEAIKKKKYIPVDKMEFTVFDIIPDVLPLGTITESSNGYVILTATQSVRPDKNIERKLTWRLFLPDEYFDKYAKYFPRLGPFTRDSFFFVVASAIQQRTLQPIIRKSEQLDYFGIVPQGNQYKLIDVSHLTLLGTSYIVKDTDSISGHSDTKISFLYRNLTIDDKFVKVDLNPNLLPALQTMIEGKEIQGTGLQYLNIPTKYLRSKNRTTRYDRFVWYVIPRKHITGIPLLLTILHEIYNDPVRGITLETEVSKKGYIKILREFHSFVQQAVEEDVIKKYEYQLPREISLILERKNLKDWKTDDPSNLVQKLKSYPPVVQSLGFSSFKDFYPDRTKWKLKFN